jgi:predicted nucleic acid-binding protein
MGTVKALFDSNILIDFIQGREEAEAELDRYEEVAISRITWMEILIGARNEAEVRLRQMFLDEFRLVELDVHVAREAISLRQDRRLKLPDAIILASARVWRGLLVTRNSRDFSPRAPGIRVPYR